MTWSWVVIHNDGFCDDEMNTSECLYDGGDCCLLIILNYFCEVSGLLQLFFKFQICNNHKIKWISVVISKRFFKKTKEWTDFHVTLKPIWGNSGIFEIFWTHDFLKILVSWFFGPEISPFWKSRDFLVLGFLVPGFFDAWIISGYPGNIPEPINLVTVYNSWFCCKNARLNQVYSKFDSILV